MDLEQLRGRVVFVAGMSRAGTTFLYHNLQKHPNIFVAGRKEICYFAHNYDEGPAWFSSFYAGLGPDQTAFDICGHYFMQPEAIDRILAFDPDARVVLGVREPSSWILSVYEQYHSQFDVPPFADFVEGCAVRREGKDIEMTFRENQIRDTVERFRERFGSNLLLYDFDVLAKDPLRLLQSIERLAGLPAYFREGNFTNARINARGRRRLPGLDRLMHLPGVASLVGRMFPRSLLLRIRSAIDARSVRKVDRTEGRVSEPSYSPEDMARVAELARADQRYLREELFRHQDIVTGAS